MRGLVLDGYELLSELGSGAMGAVYLAARPGAADAERVAIKVVHPHLANTPGVLARFRNEVEAGLRIEHPNVVRTLGAGQARANGAETSYLVMELVEGQTLAELAAVLRQVPEGLCRHVAREVAQGLAAIHDAGIVHRDVKPANVIITPDEVVKIMDLGVAQFADEARRLSQTGQFIGSLLYAAPEQVSAAERLDGRADLYALGILLHELAAGVHPARGLDLTQIIQGGAMQALRPLSERVDDVSPFFEDLVAVLAQPAPADRFASARELAGVLEEGEEGEWWQARLAAHRGRPGRRRRDLVVSRDLPLAGRGEERGQLREAFAAAAAGRGQTLLVEGEAGVGKSRLLDGFVEALRADGSPFDFLLGSNAPGDQGAAHGGLVEAAREHFAGADLVEALTARLPQTPRLVPAFAALLSGDAPPEGAPPLTEENVRVLFTALLRDLARARPLLLVLEDLHNAGEEALGLVASVAARLQAEPVLLVLTARPGLPARWTGDLARLPGARRVALDRLGRRDLHDLLVGAFGTEGSANDLADLVHEETEGNPFFVLALLEGLEKQGSIERRDDGRWTLVAPVREIAEATWPASARDLVRGRLADLSPDERDLLDVAACCGHEFDAALLARVAERPLIAVLKALARIQREHRLVRPAGRLFRFDHHQVQELLAHEMPERLRESHHAALADAVAALAGLRADRPAAVPGALAATLVAHLVHGGRAAEAAAWWEGTEAHLRATLQLRRARDLAERLCAGLPDASAERFDMLVRLARLEGDLGLVGTEAGRLEEALAMADDVGRGARRVWILLDSAWNAARRGRFEESRALLLRAESSMGEDAAPALRARAALIRGDHAFYHGREAEAAPHYEEALRYEEDPARRATVLCQLGQSLAQQGEIAAARDVLEEARVLAEQADAASALHYALVVRSTVDYRHGRPAAAIETLERLARDARELGNRMTDWNVNVHLIAALPRVGRFLEAEERARRLVDLAAEIGAPGFGVISISFHAGTLYQCGRLDEALERALEALRHEETAGSPHEEPAYGLLGYVYMALDRPTRALAMRERQLELLAASTTTGPLSDALYGRGAALLALGRAEEGAASLRAAYDAARSIHDPNVSADALCHLAEVDASVIPEARALLHVPDQTLSVETVWSARFRLWKAAGERDDLAAAHRLLVETANRMPADARSTFLEGLPLHREIVAAWRREQGAGSTRPGGGRGT